MPTNTWIYSLSDPVTLACRYVGKSNDPQKRFARHCRGQRDYLVTRWINELKIAGKTPKLSLLAEVPRSEWKDWEKAFIFAFRHLGFDLLNMNAGGSGPEAHTEATKKFISELHRGKKKPPTVGARTAERNRQRRGIPLSDEHKLKLSVALRGRKQTREHAMKRGAARVGIPRSEETKQKIRESLARTRSANAAQC